MPLHLGPLDLSDKMEDYKSALIIPCPVWPPVSLVTDQDSPFIEFFKHGIKIAAYEDYLYKLRESLEQRGVSTGVFTSYIPRTAKCLWTRAQRSRLLALCALICLSACDLDNRRQGDIYLPEGDAAKGKMHFVSLGCVSCHSVIGVELPEPAEAGPVRVLLGSRTGPRMSYGQLVTSIVNPSHRLSARYRRDEVSQEGKSLMTLYNDVLTVTQLTDLVAFLQTHYEKADRPGYDYPAHTYKAKDDSENADPR